MSLRFPPYERDGAHSFALGEFPVLELLTHQPHLAICVVLREKGFVKHANQAVLERIVLLAEQWGVPIVVDDGVIKRISHKANVFALAMFRRFDGELEPSADHLVLVQSADHGNLGAILRSALAFSVRNLVLVDSSIDPLNPHVVRASMGAVFAVQIKRLKDFAGYINAYPRAVYPFMQDGEFPLEQVQFVHPCALIFGGEVAGLPKDARAWGTSVMMAQSPLVESLNLAVAVGIALYALRTNRS